MHLGDPQVAWCPFGVAIVQTVDQECRLRLRSELRCVELLILDDWGPANLTAEQGRDLLEILDDRHGRGLNHPHQSDRCEALARHDANPTVTDAILDRLVHNARRLSLTGESLRKSAIKRPALDARTPA